MEKSRKTNVLDCQLRGFNGLQNSVLNDRYKLEKPLNRGAHGQIFMMTDLNNKRKMVMKLQENQDIASTEVGTMKKITQVFDQNQKSGLSKLINYDATPRLSDYGLVELENFK